MGGGVMLSGGSCVGAVRAGSLLPVAPVSGSVASGGCRISADENKRSLSC